MLINTKTLILLIIMFTTSIFAGKRSDIDVNADYNILTTTAETMTKGELTFNSYELAFTGLSYGATDNLQLTFTTLLPVVKGVPFVGAITGKYKLVDNSNIALALQPAFLLIDEGEDIATSVGLTFMLDFILNDDNVVTLSQASHLPISGKNREISLFDYDYVLGDLLFTMTAALSSRVSNNLKLILEITAAADYVDGELHMIEDIMFVNYGIRFFNKDLAVMLSFLKPITTNGEMIIMGLPYVSFTARF